MSQKISHPEIIRLIEKLIDSLTAIQDDNGQFLQRLPDGRVIDTKGWAGWEWTHGIGLFGLYRYHELTGSSRARQIIDAGSAPVSPKERRRRILIPRSLF